MSPVLGGLGTESSREVSERNKKPFEFNPVEIFSNQEVPLNVFEHLRAMDEPDRDDALRNFRRIAPVFQTQGKLQEMERVNKFGDIFAEYIKDSAIFEQKYGEKPQWDQFKGEIDPNPGRVR